MKKFAVLIMVLAVASLAQASMFLTIDGQDVGDSIVTCEVGKTYTIGINSTNTDLVVPVPAAYSPAIYHSMITYVHDNWKGDAETYFKLSNPVTNANMGSGAVTAQYGSPYNSLGNTGWNIQDPTVMAGLWAEWTYTPLAATDTGTIQLLWWSADYGTTTFLDTIYITNIVPEPATMSLLGLGVLGLLRKRS